METPDVPVNPSLHNIQKRQAFIDDYNNGDLYGSQTMYYPIYRYRYRSSNRRRVDSGYRRPYLKPNLYSSLSGYQSPYNDGDYFPTVI